MYVPALVATSEPVRQPSETATVVITITVEGLRIPAVRVELHGADTNVVIAETTSDGVGQVQFPDVPQGRYFVRAFRDGFEDAETTAFTVAGGSTAQVLVEMRLTFVRESVEVVVPYNSPTESLQPVAVSDVLTGARMDVQPLAGDDFQSLLTTLPSILRGPDGRLRIKGGVPTTGALQVSSASLNDPSTGDFDLELPSGAVESVEVLSNPFAAEYGRFSTSVTQVRTKRGTNDWHDQAGQPDARLRQAFGFVDKFEPRLSISGPIKTDCLLFGQYLQYRYVRTPVKSLPGEPALGLDSFDSFTRLDAIISSRHSFTGGVIYFPRKITNPTISTFRPPDTTPKYTQEGFSAGPVDRLILSAHVVLETTFAGRLFEVDAADQGRRDRWSTRRRRRAAASSTGRSARSAATSRRSAHDVEGLAGQHVFKFGLDLQDSRYDGEDYSQQLDVRRLDGSLAERTTYSPVHASRGERPRVRRLRSGPLAAQRSRDVRAGPSCRPRRHRRDGELLTARRRVDQRAARGARRSCAAASASSIERTPLDQGAFTQYQTQTVTRLRPARPDARAARHVPARPRHR